MRIRVTTFSSVEQIDRTYGHPFPDAADHERGLLDASTPASAEPLGADRARANEPAPLDSSRGAEI